MAYYAKEKPRALIMPWGQFDKNNPDTSLMSNTRLEEALSEVSTVVGVAYSSIKPNTKYYDFQYPSANGLTLISESRPDTGVDSFRFRVPSEYVLYDASWEYYSYDSYPLDLGVIHSWFKLDGNELVGTDGVNNHNSNSIPAVERQDERYFGTISALTKDVLHKGDLAYTAWGTDEGSSNIAIVLIYKQQ
jgi:hypothetical protein